MAEGIVFKGFDAYKLIGVSTTNKELGHGSYATVLELEYMGLKCAGKKIHEVLVKQGDASYTVRRFEEECRLLSQVRHPNIVQFLGVYFQQGVRAPILIMEFLPTNLTSCIEQYGILPKKISYSILHDVALGLCYLHSQTPAIIHRDLSSNNVLLTPNMTAKISDLGVARILNLTPRQVSRMTQTPGTPAYMPPEVMVANPKYDTSVDIFSYGILMIHIFSGRWPEPQVGPTQIEDGKLIPVSEAERRDEFLQDFMNDCPLLDLILLCIDNHPQVRAHANELVNRLAKMVKESPSSFRNRLDFLRHIEKNDKEREDLRDKVEQMSETIDKSKVQISSLNEEIHAKEQQLAEETGKHKAELLEQTSQLKMVHTREMDEFQLKIRDLNDQYRSLTTEKETELTELQSKIERYESELESSAKILIQAREQFDKQLAKKIEQHRENLAKEKQEHETQLTKERDEFQSSLADARELDEKLTAENSQLLSEVSKLKSGNAILQYRNSTLVTSCAHTVTRKNMAIAKKDSEIEEMTRALQEQDCIISEISQQLIRAREYLTAKQQVSSK